MERVYYDLTSSQQILFYSQKYTVHKQVNNICTSVLTDTELDFDILKETIHKAYERNDALRVRILKVGKHMKQYFADYEEPPVEHLDFRGKTLEEREMVLYKIAHKPVTVFGESMSKIYMMHSYDGKCGIYFVVSHMIMDSWAITTFFKDVLAIYGAIAKGTDMPKPLYPYEELLKAELNYKNTETYTRDRGFWGKLLDKENEPIFTHVNGYSVLEKYRKRKRNPNVRYGQTATLFTKADNVMLPVHKELVQRMAAYCTVNRLPMQSLVLLALRSYLSKMNRNEKDVTLRTVVARRGTLKEKNTGGSRVRFFPFRTILNESHTFKKACEIISEKQSEIYRHAEMDSLEIIDIWRKAYDTPLLGGYAAVTLTYQPVKLGPLDGMKLETKWYGNGAFSDPIYVTVMDGDGTGELKFYYEYQVHTITLETVQKLHSYMKKVIEAGINDDELTIGQLLKIE